MEKIKQKVAKTYDTGKTIVENMEHLAQTVSLMIVVALGVYAMLKLNLHQVIRGVCWTALVIIGARAGYEFFKYFDFKRK